MPTSSRFRIPWRTIRSWLAYAAIPAAGLATAPMMARALGPTGRGELAAILQPLTVAGAFAAIGVPAAITFFVGRGHPTRRTRRAGFPIILLSSTFVYLCLLLYSAEIARVAHVPQIAVALIWLSVFPGALLALRRSAWQGLRRFAPLDLERAAAGFTRFGLIALLFLAGITIAPLYVVVYITAGLSASAFLFKRLPNRNSTAERPPLLTRGMVLRYSLLASIGTIMATLNNRLDQAVLPSAIGAMELGLYSVAVTVAEVPFIITTVMVRNLLAESSHQSPALRLRRTFLVGMTGVLCASVGLAVISPYFVPLLFGEAFAPSIPAIWLLLSATTVGSAAEGMNAILAGQARPGLASLSAGAGALGSVSLLWIFWDGMSLQGAAMVSLGAQLCAISMAVFILWRFLRRRRNATGISSRQATVISGKALS